MQSSFHCKINHLLNFSDTYGTCVSDIIALGTKPGYQRKEGYHTGPIIPVFSFQVKNILGSPLKIFSGCMHWNISSSTFLNVVLYISEYSFLIVITEKLSKLLHCLNEDENHYSQLIWEWHLSEDLCNMMLYILIQLYKLEVKSNNYIW